MNHCGMDVHLRSTTVETLDDATGEVRRVVVRTEREALRAWLGATPRMRVVLEAGTLSHWVAELAENLGHEVVVVDPNRTKAVAVAGGYKKTDAVDAATLAWLSSKGAVAPSHRPGLQTRRQRKRLMLRQRLVRSRGDLVRAVRAALVAEGWVVRGRKSRGFAAAVRQLGEAADVASLEGALRAIEELEEQIKEADGRLEAEAKADEVVGRLMSVDGIGPVVGMAYRLVVEDPRRFRSGRRVAAYVGLVPSVHNSGDAKNRLGRISKHGDPMVRYLLVEAAHSLLYRCRRPSELREWGLKVMARVGRKKAAVAVARKMCVLMWAIWRKGTTFKRALPKVAAAA